MARYFIEDAEDEKIMTEYFLGEEKIALEVSGITTIEQAKKYTEAHLAPYYTKDEIAAVTDHYMKIIRPGVVLSDDGGEIYL